MKEAVEKLDTVTVVSGNIPQFLWIFLIVNLERLEPLRFHPVG